MKFRVDPWSAEYGTSVDGDLAASEAVVNVEVERAAGEWAPIPVEPATPVPETILFVDGVRRVDARIWIEDDHGATQPGVCASFAAGVVRCRTGAVAEVASWRVGRGVFSSSPAVSALETVHGTYEARPAASPAPEDLWRAVHDRMGRAEVEATEAALRDHDGSDPLVAVDGTLRERTHLRGAVGVVKSHAVQYLPDPQHAVVAALRPGERTPVFSIGTSWLRHSWYLRLPGGDDAPWVGVVRIECSGDLAPAEAIERAGVTAATLGRFASEPHRDARAPQNLVPIGGLERELRRRLGDPHVLYRALRRAAA